MNIKRKSGFIAFMAPPIGASMGQPQGDGTTGGFQVTENGGEESILFSPTGNYITFSEDGGGESVSVA